MYFLQSLSRTRDCQRQKKQWLSADNAGRTGLILATLTSSSVQWCVCVLLKKKLQHLSGQSPVVRLRAPHLPHSGVALQSNLAQHSFPSRRSRWQGYGSVGWSAETLNKLLKECCANTALFFVPVDLALVEPPAVEAQLVEVLALDSWNHLSLQGPTGCTGTRCGCGRAAHVAEISHHDKQVH